MLRTSVFTVLVKMATTAIGFLTAVLLARAYGASGSGEIFVWLSTIAIIATFGMLGMDRSLTRAVAQQSYRLVSTSQLIIFAACASLVVPIIYLVFMGVSVGFDSEVSIEAIIVACNAILYSTLILSCAALRGMERPLISVVLSTLLQSALFFIMVLFLSHNTLPKHVLIMYAASLGICAIVSLVIALRVSMAMRGGRPELRQGVGVMMKAAPALVILGLGGMASNSLPIVLLGSYSAPEQASYFAVALKITSVFGLLMSAVNMTFAASFARLFDQGDLVSLNKTARKAATYQLLLSIPLFVVIGLMADPVLEVFGSDFLGAKDALFILLLAQIVNVMTGPVTMLLVMMGLNRDILWISLVSMIVALLPAIWLISDYGGTGAGIVVLINIAIQNLGGLLVLRFKYGVSVLPELRVLSAAINKGVK